MEFLTHSLIGVLAYFPSILLLFGIYMIWEQARLLNRQLSGISQILTAIHREQGHGSVAERPELKR